MSIGRGFDSGKATYRWFCVSIAGSRTTLAQASMAAWLFAVWLLLTGLEDDFTAHAQRPLAGGGEIAAVAHCAVRFRWPAAAMMTLRARFISRGKFDARRQASYFCWRV
jgi:hypothetical protein